MLQKKKLGLAMASVMLVGSVLTGCGSNGSDSTSSASAQPSSSAAVSDAGKKTTITFWAAATTPERDAFWQGVVKDFMAKNPNITVNYLGVPGDLNGYIQKLNVSIAAGEGPDIINNFTSDFIGRDVLEPLDTYMSNWDKKDKITTGSIASMKAADPVGGKLYGLPYAVLPWVEWVRPDWLKEANLPVQGDWNNFFEAAKKLTDKSKDRYGYSIRGGAGSATTLEYLMYSYSGITNYFTKDGKATINDPKHVEFLEKYLGNYNVLTPEDDLNKGWTELAASFQSGKVGMIFHNLGSASAQNKAFNNDLTKFTATPFPTSLQGTNVQPGVTPSVMMMLKTSKNKDAAWKFMTYFVSNSDSPYGQLYGEIPTYLDALKDDWIQKVPYIKTGADLMSSPDTKFTDNPVYLPGYNKVQTNMAPMIQKVMAKKMTAKELLDEWAKQLEKEKADFDAANKSK
ncbi:ABC transporter substrate-binding protein [Paenibacillus hexagrammi]|uniref:Sugar ABC transporter substrate-binding protein n=1 Tax=Paenibacillus hexagrammi TaxID=2908839 RepID=A0ABY3SCK0_9BACL|nr:sugar ABC transporter substrate-binding protein [Paenibacillus sp. YPD9-1]UJF31732.1 sugar ABC transporter substrate-binding protein [Paenibacillus sp. YPD9-1]